MTELIIEEKVPVAVIVGDVLPELFAQLKQHSVKIVYRPINPSPEAAQAAEVAGADIIVATGFDEGGMLPNAVIGTAAIVPIIKAATSLPVLAAGGIGDRAAVRAMLSLSADGVYVGSRFIASNECAAADSVKEKIVAAQTSDLRLFRTQPAYYRALDTGESDNLASKLADLDAAGASRETLYQTMNAGGGLRTGFLDGDLQAGFISLGTGVSSIKSVLPAAQIVCELMAECC